MSRDMRSLLICALATTVLSASAGNEASGRAGEALFDRHCAECHAAGDGHPGTMRLAARLDGVRPVLLERSDLTADTVAFVVRHGLQMMPPFRPTELTDAEIAELAAWVAGGRGQEAAP